MCRSWRLANIDDTAANEDLIFLQSHWQFFFLMIIEFGQSSKEIQKYIFVVEIGSCIHGDWLLSNCSAILYNASNVCVFHKNPCNFCKKTSDIHGAKQQILTCTNYTPRTTSTNYKIYKQFQWRIILPKINNISDG